MIGKYEEILKLTEGDIENFIQVDKDEGRVISMLDQREIYYLKNLALARSIDFRPDRANVKGILLVICSPAPVWRNYQQWLGRVGRHGDQCEWFRLCPEINAMKNSNYISRLEITSKESIETVLKEEKAIPKEIKSRKEERNKGLIDE